MASTIFGEVPALGLPELRANKLASGRPKDLADVALLDELVLARGLAGAKRRKRSTAKGSRRLAVDVPDGR